MWTEEADNTLRAKAKTHSAAQIANELGTTRDAVLGRAHRIGLSLASPDKPRGFHSINPQNRRSRKGFAAPTGAAVCRPRPFGARAYTLMERAGAVAALLAGASQNRAARLVGASPQSVARIWVKDKEVMSRAREIYDEAVRRATSARRQRQGLLDIQRKAVADHNERIIVGWSERNKAIVRRKCDGESLATVAADYGITRERARQVLMKAVKAGLLSPPDQCLLRDKSSR